MKIKAPQISIPVDDPFKNDLLNRRENAEILTQLISTIEEPFVIAIDSPWGTGKTVFIKMFMQYLKNQEFSCLYFNAWENDFNEDPLFSLIGEVGKGIDSIKNDKETKQKYLSEAKKLGAYFLKKSLPVAVKLVTAGVVDIKELADLAENIAKEKIDKYEEDKKTIQSFKKSLSDFVKELACTNVKGKTKPLIFFIDELDRCRPDYAVKLMEKAKHFFNVENIIFFLAIDKEQIGHSIRSIYGVGMDVDGYLRRFIDLDYHLPDPSNNIFCNALFAKFGFDQYFKNGADKDRFIRVLSKLFTIFEFTLRVQEQCFSQLSLALRTISPDHRVYPLLLGTLISLKAKYIDLYKDFVKEKVGLENVLKYIRELPGGNSFLENVEDNDGTVLEAYLITCCLDKSEDIITQYKNINKDDKLPEYKKKRPQLILNILSSYDMRCNYNTLKNIAKSIDISERFFSKNEE